MDIHRWIDHSVLKPEMNLAEARAAIDIGLRFHVRTICARPADIALAREMCAGTDTDVISVLAFPHGTALTDSKRDEARRLVDAGVFEIDMVAHYAWLRSAEWTRVADDIRAVVDVARPAKVGVKVILETSQLSPEEIRQGTLAAVAAEADFVKTSTGFTGGGATEEAVRIMLDTGAGRIQVKPAGGIRDRAAAERFLALGVHRLGVGYASTSVICGDDAS